MVQVPNTVVSLGGIIRDEPEVVTKAISPDPRQALNAIRTLRRSLGRIQLPDEVLWEAGWALDEAKGELRMPDPDRGFITARLERFTELLTGAGADAPAGTSLNRSIRTIVAWLGPMGASLLGRVA
ncbi:MAG: hypothetical protein L0206_00215 [Actinobacteria bacterium]|nr:hypothetical protein [Actinomycetota bacterium]